MVLTKYKCLQHDHLGRPRKQKLTKNGKLVMEVRAKCFNASLAVQKYDRCPTCAEHHSIAVVEQYTDPETSNDLLHRINGNDHFIYALLILSAFTAVLTTGFACLFIAFLHQKRRLKVCTSKQRLHSEPLNTIHTLHACPEDTRYSLYYLSTRSTMSQYDVPWEQVSTTYRRPPYRNLSSKGSFTAMPPSLIGPVSDVTALARPDIRKTSPSSSFGAERHDDSGLESV
ncbi:unnamed protein product [Gongylonema pulchrum]|uniref:Uncharacterized protein n=1 Tax=Gongylonema pulchrum TaxID=637853 RepID=A0A3P7M794_9BILA|nr:unnamed protein product [Gongylonema pulchrum]